MKVVKVRASTSAYLNSCNQYAYITGILVYEDLSLFHDANQEMEYLVINNPKEENQNKAQDPKEESKTHGIREGTESTKDATFTSGKLTMGKGTVQPPQHRVSRPSNFSNHLVQ